MAPVPLVLIPGIQGHWKYTKRAVDALSRDFNVRTFSLAPATSLDEYVDQVTRTLDQSGVERAVVCGVSFGGLVAVRFAACHPGRTSALVLVSTPAPRLRLRPRHQLYTRLPWIFGPLFMAEAPLRLNKEIVAALPDLRERWMFRLSVLRVLPFAPISFSNIATRARMITATDLTPDCRRINAPTLVMTGEGDLDHVVPVEGTSAYTTLIANARAVTIPRTGHLGSITRPDVFASLISEFMDATLTERVVATNQRGEPGARGAREREGATEVSGNGVLSAWEKPSRGRRGLDPAAG